MRASTGGCLFEHGAWKLYVRVLTPQLNERELCTCLFSSQHNTHNTPFWFIRWWMVLNGIRHRETRLCAMRQVQSNLASSVCNSFTLFRPCNKIFLKNRGREEENDRFRFPGSSRFSRFSPKEARTSWSLIPVGGVTVTEARSMAVRFGIPDVQPPGKKSKKSVCHVANDSNGDKWNGRIWQRETGLQTLSNTGQSRLYPWCAVALLPI